MSRIWVVYSSTYLDHESSINFCYYFINDYKINLYNWLGHCIIYAGGRATNYIISFIHFKSGNSRHQTTWKKVYKKNPIVNGNADIENVDMSI
jgi:hypothetical protein